MHLFHSFAYSRPDPKESIAVEEAAEAEDEDEEETISTSASVVSSSFRMTITAVEMPTWRRGLLLRGAKGERRLESGGQNGRGLEAASHPSIDEKERPAVTDHLTRVYSEALSISPADISLVFEEDLVAEEISPSSGRGFGGGVVRKTVFRVMGEYRNIHRFLIVLAVGVY